MDEHREMIWQGGSRRAIIREAKRRFENTREKDPVAAHVELASAYYSLATRYSSGLGKFWRNWYGWKALVTANDALTTSYLQDKIPTPDQADVIATILAGVPKRWRDSGRIINLVVSALQVRYPKTPDMKPHTRALLLLTLAQVRLDIGQRERAEELYQEAEELVPKIRKEDSADRELQLIRVLKKVGFHYFQSGNRAVVLQGETLVAQALDLARAHSKDQHAKIQEEWRRLKNLHRHRY